MTTIAAIIPVLGRRPLLQHTIQRLKTKNKITHIICVGDNLEDKILCESLGAIWVNCENYPLGHKWNRGFHMAEMFDPNYYLFVGSSDWISDNWIDVSIEHLNKGYDMVGKLDFWLLDNGNDNHLRMCHWHGYTQEERKNEPIGIGRLLTASIMKKINYTPFSGNIHSGLDRSMYDRIHLVGGSVGVIKDDNIFSLSVSDAKWPNKHIFEDHWSGKLQSDIITEGVDTWLRENFPEALLL